MKLRRTFRRFEHDFEDTFALTTNTARVVLKNIGWVSAGVGVLAVGVVIGRELRQRYKFNRRTPYDHYAHSGDSRHDVEFGVGI